MRKLQGFIFCAAFTGLVALPASPACAQGRPVAMLQTGCDTLSLSPPLLRLTFAVINHGTTPVCSVHLTPVQSGPTPADSCRILECSNPPGWQCQLDADGGASWRIDPAGSPGCIGFGGRHESFDVVLDPLYCCYLAQFDGPDGQVFYEDVLCLECDKPAVSERR